MEIWQNPDKGNDGAEGDRNGVLDRCDLAGLDRGVASTLHGNWKQDWPVKKICADCKEPKLLDDFHRHKSHVLGRDTRCKACKRVSREKRYRLDPGGAVKASRAWKDGNAVRARVHKQRVYARKVTAAAEDTVGDPGDLTADQWEEVLETYRVGDSSIDPSIIRLEGKPKTRRYRCAYCGAGGKTSR